MAKTSISVCKGKGSLTHNNRAFITENVDVSRTPDNITYISEPLQVAYEKCFGQAIEEYNARQKRADRRIDGVKGYMEQIRTSGNGEKLFYETIFQVGNMYDSHVGTPQGDLCAKILDEYARDFQARNPHLYLFNAVLHLDEQTPHLHLDYIPLAHGYKQGLAVRNSLDRAFKEQGFDGKANKYENRTIAWQRSEKDRIEEIMHCYGLERAPEKGLEQEHMTVDQYKAVTSTVRNEVAQIPKQIESAPMFFNKKRVTVRKEDLERLEQRARLSLEHEKATKELVSALKHERNEAKEYISEKMAEAHHHEERAQQTLEQAQKELQKAEETRYRSEQMYSAQKNLNEEYSVLYNAYKRQKETIDGLRAENSQLKAENLDLKQSIEERVREAVEPLQAQVRSLRERLEGMCQSLTNVTKAFGMLKHDKTDGYKVTLNDKQSRLFDAIEKYTTKWLRTEKQEEMAVDVEKHIGISDGIADEVKKLTPKRTVSHDRGR